MTILSLTSQVPQLPRSQSRWEPDYSLTCGDPSQCRRATSARIDCCSKDDETFADSQNSPSIMLIMMIISHLKESDLIFCSAKVKPGSRSYTRRNSFSTAFSYLGSARCTLVIIMASSFILSTRRWLRPCDSCGACRSPTGWASPTISPLFFSWSQRPPASAISTLTTNTDMTMIYI